MSSATLERHLTLVRQPSAPPARRASRVRLTRRGRVLVLLVCALAALLALGWGAQGVRASISSDGPATAYVSVEPGDTLWGIAERVAPSDDPRDVVARIEDLNDLPSAVVRAGQLLVVPAA
ncbi:LysM domain-containing protein [Motilibacter peucedani]|uniref:LysM domain-containing protein n=1 Tax=Motilibacter peucedani TaxID=598650 RepID=A0A420XRB3_9ACTN|nr:LysM peptidoglycan-binding domain-containing protein [Motilibacter peucedani]RKS77446.1 LysM domain-containing protein [Motilibacter peucedani]